MIDGEIVGVECIVAAVGYESRYIRGGIRYTLGDHECLFPLLYRVKFSRHFSWENRIRLCLRATVTKRAWGNEYEGEGEQTRVINFHIVLDYGERFVIFEKLYRLISRVLPSGPLWIVPALEYRANECYDTPYLLAGNTSKDWKTRWEIYFS